MKFSGNLRKMDSSLEEEVYYSLVLFDVLEPKEEVPLNELIGQKICISFDGAINCVVSGKKISKVFGEGMSYEAFMNSPEASPSIIRPELSRIHEGIALRDYDWEMAHHMQPHYVYLSLTNAIKVGVTRVTQMPTRWIDQGATEAIILAQTPYRQAAGLIEVALKNYVPDKTNWQRMLKNDVAEHLPLREEKQRLIPMVPEELHSFLLNDNTVMHINYPVLRYPEKVISLKLDKSPDIEGKLVGIRGQYLIFENGSVLNVRSHSGYRVSFEY
jgi:hypothetical protein